MMRTKTIALKCLIHFLGILSLIMVLSSRNVGGIGAFMVRFAGVKGMGDLYYMTGIGYFRQNKEYPPVRNKIGLKDADVIVYGDSFGLMTAGGGGFHARLQELLNAPVFWQYHMWSNTDFYKSPLQWLEERDPSEIKAKILILLKTERYINRRYLNCQSLISNRQASKADDGVTKDDRAGNGPHVRGLLFDNSKLEYVARTCIPTRWVFEAIATSRFFLFGKTSNLVPQYSISPRMLYYYEDIDAFNESLESKDIEEVVAFSVKLRDILMERYGMHLVFVPIPTKYTIYHDYGDPDSTYNDFLPLLAEKLKENEVICVDVYPTFMRERSKILYWSDDTHWNGKGVEIAAALTKTKIIEKNLLDSRSQEK